MNLIQQKVLSPFNSQVALYFASDTLFKPIQLANEISIDFEEIFEAEPFVLPMDSPREIPKIILKQDEVGQLTISYERADLVLNWKNDCGSENVIEFSKKLVRCLVDKYSLSIIRIGLVTSFRWNEIITIKELKEKYIQSGKLQDIQEMNLAWFKRVSINDKVVNRWVRFILSSNSNNKIVTIDTNTLPEENNYFNEARVEEIISNWVKNVWSDINDILEW